MFFKDITCISFGLIVTAGILLLSSFTAMAQHTDGDAAMTAVRISPQDAHQQVASGEALLVCAYQDGNSCKDMLLEGAITLSAFESKLPTLKKDQAIIFYCA